MKTKYALKGTIWVLLLFGATVAMTASEVPDDAQTVVLADDTVIKLWQAPGREGPRTPFYAIAPAGDPFHVRETSYLLRLRYANFEPLADVAPHIAEPVLEQSGKMVIVQFVTQPLPAYRQAIRDLGGSVYFYLPHHAHLVAIDPALQGQLEALPFVRWVGPFKAAYRLEEVLIEGIGNRSLENTRYNIMLRESGLPTKHSVADRITAMDGKVHRAHAGKFLLEATLSAAQLAQVAAFDEVVFIDRWSPLEPDMDNARIVSGANFLETMAGFTGQGVRGEVLDGGFNIDHVDFQSRPLILHTPVSVASHGAATSGIVFGDGTGDPTARGMLPDAQGIVADSSEVFSGQPRYDHTGELVQEPYNAVFQTASVGSAQTTNYTTLSADTDAMLFDFDILHCQSQSNLGNRNSRPQAWAKNVLSGGGVRHFNDADPSDDCWCNGASIGPASDNRIKPDLSHFYDATRTTTTGSTTAYTSGFGGTSGATPIICGHAGLVFQMWSEGIFGNTHNPNASVFDNRPHMTTAKALMINTAAQYPFTGAAHDLTRVHQGWGQPNVQNLYEIREKLIVIDETDILANLGSSTYQVTVTPGEPALKATMIYADPPGTPGAGLHRINDLTLKVTSPTGTEFWGNNGLLEGNWSTPGGLANNFDTVENVFVENPEAGVWTVLVSADEINQDGHVETAALDADYALVVSGAQMPGFTIATDNAFQEVCTPEDGVFELDLDPILGSVAPVTLSVTGLPPGTSSAFSQNPVTPPAMPTLTIGNTALAQSGLFTLEITATSSQVERTLFVDISVSNGLPAVVTTLSPAEDAADVSRFPAFQWQPDANALNFAFQLASDAGFTNLIIDELTSETSRAPSTVLDPLTEYFWRVRAENGCGQAAWSTVSSFTTRDVADYQTEQFSGGNDLDNLSLVFVPNGGLDFYTRCVSNAVALPTDPSGGMPLSLDDDNFIAVALGTSVPFFGEDYDTVYVGSNGYVTFTTGDDNQLESLSTHFNLPRIAGVYDDLDPTAGGTVSYKELGDRLAITFENVPEFDGGNSNTFQFEIFYSGDVVITFLGIDAGDGLAGLSAGLGTPLDYAAADLSTETCEFLCAGDLNGDDTIDLVDFLLIAGGWRENGPEDLNGDGVTDIFDLLLIASLFGACP